MFRQTCNLNHKKGKEWVSNKLLGLAPIGLYQERSPIKFAVVLRILPAVQGKSLCQKIAFHRFAIAQFAVCKWLYYPCTRMVNNAIWHAILPLLCTQLDCGSFALSGRACSFSLFTVCVCTWMLEYSFPRLFVPWSIRSHDGTFVLRTIRSLEHSFPGPFVPWTIRSRDRILRAKFIPLTTTVAIHRSLCT